MIPARRSEPMNLADVLPACVAATRGEPNLLDLGRVNKAVVLVVDGLGMSMLNSRRGHARSIMAAHTKNSKIRSEFPTTTAASLATLMTGERPGVHGLVGYTALDPHNDRVVNQLNGWDADMPPLTWQRVPTIFEQTTIPSFSVGHPRYADSGFSRAILRGSTYRSAITIMERCLLAREILDQQAQAIVYIYVPELDQIAHRLGWQSPQWTQTLEELDAAVNSLSASLRSDEGLLLTADHGVVDVPSQNHVLIDPTSSHLDGVRHVAGEPRGLQLHCHPDASPLVRDRLIERWRTSEAGRSVVVTRAEAVEQGWFGPHVDAAVLARIGDLIVAPIKMVAYYIDSDETVSAQRMIGQHGSRSDEESVVPLIRWGAFRR